MCAQMRFSQYLRKFTDFGMRSPGVDRNKRKLLFYCGHGIHFFDEIQLLRMVHKITRQKKMTCFAGIDEEL